MIGNKGRDWKQDPEELRGEEERLEDGFMKGYPFLRRESLKGTKKTRLWECEIAGI